jgi:hypothetical protein
MSAADAVPSIGTSIGQGLVDGMASMVAAVRSSGNALGEAAAAGAREGAQVHSPSKLTMEVGAYMAQGLAIGMTDSPAPERAGREISGNAIGGLSARAIMAPAANSNGSGASISGVTINITAPHGVTDAASLSATGLVVALERLQIASGR